MTSVGLAPGLETEYRTMGQVAFGLDQILGLVPCTAGRVQVLRFRWVLRLSLLAAREVRL